MEDRFVHQLKKLLRKCDKQKLVSAKEALSFFSYPRLHSTVGFQSGGTSFSVCAFFSTFCVAFNKQNSTAYNITQKIGFFATSLHHSLFDALRRVLVRIHEIHELSRQLVQQRRDDILARLVAQLIKLHELHHLRLTPHRLAHITFHLTALERQLLLVAIQHLHEVEVTIAHAHDDDRQWQLASLALSPPSPCFRICQ